MKALGLCVEGRAGVTRVHTPGSAGQLLAFSKVLTLIHWHVPFYFLASFFAFIAANISAASP